MKKTQNIKFSDDSMNNIKNSSTPDFSSTKIKFTGDTVDTLAYSPEIFKNSFYQICQYKGKNSDLYQVRKVIFNEKFEITKMFEKEYNAKTIEKFLKNNDPNKYKIYPIGDLKFLAPPNSSDFMASHSDLTNKKISNKWSNMQCKDMFTDYTYGGIQNAHTMASPGSEISALCRRVGAAPKEYYNGAPTMDNLFNISNNLV
jgi:hypothetical protein